MGAEKDALGGDGDGRGHRSLDLRGTLMRDEADAGNALPGSGG